MHTECVWHLALCDCRLAVRTCRNEMRLNLLRPRRRSGVATCSVQAVTQHTIARCTTRHAAQDSVLLILTISVLAFLETIVITPSQ